MEIKYVNDNGEVRVLKTRERNEKLTVREVIDGS